MSAHILIVDDESAVRDTLADWLVPEGYEIAVAASADEALAAVTGPRTFDAALVDLGLPGEDGVWLARALRERQSDLAVIMCTGWQSFEAAVEGMRIGVNDYLLKPFTRVELTDSIRRALKWRHDLQQSVRAHEALCASIASRREALMAEFRRLTSPSAADLEAIIARFATRSAEAQAHARRVARMSVFLAEELGVGATDIRAIEHGALLHDIGKIALPDELMLKDSPLTDEEIRFIRTHPELGASVVAASPALADVAAMVQSSHEAWDGSGYPQGLVGDAIPLGARIIAVTDTFDALTWSRIFRESVTTSRAAAELVRSAGTQFDPDVVHAWLRVLDGGAESRVA
ncbi:MAG: HD domain-containing phosphohydrolase [Acidobacteriota bacterium]